MAVGEGALTIAPSTVEIKWRHRGQIQIWPMGSIFKIWLQFPPRLKQNLKLLCDNGRRLLNWIYSDLVVFVKTV